jgi:hypothetical protein
MTEELGVTLEGVLDTRPDALLLIDEAELRIADDVTAEETVLGAATLDENAEFETLLESRPGALEDAELLTAAMETNALLLTGAEDEAAGLLDAADEGTEEPLDETAVDVPGRMKGEATRLLDTTEEEATDSIDEEATRLLVRAEEDTELLTGTEEEAAKLLEEEGAELLESAEEDTEPLDETEETTEILDEVEDATDDERILEDTVSQSPYPF